MDIEMQDLITQFAYYGCAGAFYKGKSDNKSDKKPDITVSILQNQPDLGVLLAQTFVDPTASPTMDPLVDVLPEGGKDALAAFVERRNTPSRANDSASCGKKPGVPYQLDDINCYLYLITNLYNANGYSFVSSIPTCTVTAHDSDGKELKTLTRSYRKMTETFQRWTTKVPNASAKQQPFSYATPFPLHIDLLSAFDMAYPVADGSYKEFKKRYKKLIARADSVGASGVVPVYVRALDDLAALWVIRYHKTCVEYRELVDDLKNARVEGFEQKNASNESEMITRTHAKGRLPETSTDVLEKDEIDRIFEDAESADDARTKLLDVVKQNPTEFDLSRHYGVIARLLTSLEEQLGREWLPMHRGYDLYRVFANPSSSMAEKEGMVSILYEALLKKVFRAENIQSRTDNDNAMFKRIKFLFQIPNSLDDPVIPNGPKTPTTRAHEQRLETIVAMLRVLLILAHIRTTARGVEMENLLKDIETDLERCGVKEFTFGEVKDSLQGSPKSASGMALSVLLHNHCCKEYDRYRPKEGSIIQIERRDQHKTDGHSSITRIITPDGKRRISTPAKTEGAEAEA